MLAKFILKVHSVLSHHLTIFFNVNDPLSEYSWQFYSIWEPGLFDCNFQRNSKHSLPLEKRVKN